MSLPRHRYGAPEPYRRWVPPQTVALVRRMFVVEADKGVEAPRQCGARGEVAAAKFHAPVLLQDRALEPLHKAVGPGVARLGPGVPNTVSPTGLIKRAVEFAAAVGEDSLNRPARPAIVREEDPGEEAAAVKAGSNQVAASRAVICQTLPTPLSLPM
jgi:hypothetical protein